MQQVTLILANADAGTQILVADRRFIDGRNGRVIEPNGDMHHKLMIFMHPQKGYQFAVAFTGLAQVGGIRVMEWLPNAFEKAVSLKDDWRWAIHNFTNVCNAELTGISKYRPEFRKLTFVFCGRTAMYHQVLKKAGVSPFIAIVTNLNRLSENQPVSRETFQAYSKLLFPGNRKCLTRLEGDVPRKRDFIKKYHECRRRLRKSVSRQQKVVWATDLIRLAADSRTTIGKNMLSRNHLTCG